MQPLEIAKDIFYVGVNDRVKHLFENLWPLPYGVSYNSYLVCDEKTALIDTVDLSFSGRFFHQIKAVLGDRPIDYLVINHMEPDHSGSIEWLVSQYPDIRIVGNKRTLDMLEGYYGITGRELTVKNEEELSLGNCRLKFYLTPMVHWPETMMSYLPEKKALFSGDAFGTFGTLDGGVIDSQLLPEKYWDEMIRYYSNIVGKYGSSVQAALKKLEGVPIGMICATHGPIWKEEENIARVIALYDRLSRYEAEEGLVIAYGSMYGHTEQLAEMIAAAAAEKGVKQIVLHHVSKSHLSDIIRDVFKYKGLIIGSPTYNNKLYPAVQSLFDALEGRCVKDRLFGCFGCFSWADATAKLLTAFAEGMHFNLVEEPVVMKQAMVTEVREKAVALGYAMAEKLQAMTNG